MAWTPDVAASILRAPQNVGGAPSDAPARGGGQGASSQGWTRVCLAQLLRKPARRIGVSAPHSRIQVRMPARAAGLLTRPRCKVVSDPRTAAAA
jgi:hypothetical protein